MKYDHERIERKWQKVWKETGLYRQGLRVRNKKFYVLDMFPYPSGEGLHVGHPKGYIATDVVSRMRRMQGHAVLHPMGFDAFGLPAENYALKTKTHPEKAVKKNISRYKKQLKILGFDYDWSREINTTDPRYYKWTQWIFLQMFKRGLAYQSHEPINWCPSCKTGLANEDVESGHCERCGTPVERKPMRQWVLKITDYAERLLADLDGLEWPKNIVEQQRNWIGKSEGSVITFALARTGADLTQTDAEKRKIGEVEVFTTRADTLFGATYLVLAPENEIVESLKSKVQNRQELEKYINETKKKTEIERTAGGKEKTGVELKGVKAINPANNEEIPIWVADYVLPDYGTGAIMAVPAHDERDFAFATKYKLPIRHVIEPVFTQTDGVGAVDKTKPYVEREVIMVVVKHWSEDKYIGLKWKKVDWDTFITGGIESGQTPEEAAIAEIREETGFQNTKLICELPRFHSKFFHVPKNQNRFAHFRVFYFELKNGSRNEISDEEKANHDVVWLSPKELASFRLPDGHRFAWNMTQKDVNAYCGGGILGNSGDFNGLNNEEAKEKITEFVGGTITTKYKLRDWVFSRQRYWGEPIPLIFCEECKKRVGNPSSLNAKRYTLNAGERLNPGWIAVPERDLPVRLPKVEHYEPTGTGESPLANIEKWVNVTCPKCEGKGKRETNTMPQWAGSSWYHLAYIVKKTNRYTLHAKRSLKEWLPVDLYVGGAEHATRHLIYARFWHKFLQDIGIVSVPEPFVRLRPVGLIMGEDGRKMSKRFGNVINPDDIVKRFGADSLRVYEMFMGPFEQAIAWSTDSLVGSRRFLERVWKISARTRNHASSQAPSSKLQALLHQTIGKVTKDIEAFKFNTAISSLMILLNALERESGISQEAHEIFLKLLAPFAPHISEELWAQRGYKRSVHLAPWPAYDEKIAVDASIVVVVQVNGKTRGSFTATRGEPKDYLEKKALALQSARKWIEGKTITAVVVVPDRLVNVVTAQRG